MSRFEGQVPGGVLKTIVEEHQVMDELVQLLKRRVDLDEKYNQDLAALYGNFNPKWKNSAIYSLFSPVLAFFEKDVTIRRETCESIKDILDDIPVTNSPDILEEGGSMFDEYQKLIEVNERLKENHEAARSRDSVAKLQEWLSIVAPKSKYGEQGLFTTIQVFNSVQMAGFRLPEADRKYRQSVYLQQQIAWKVSKWHSNVLPNILETHQDRSDRIKAMLQKVGNCYSDQSNWMVEELSMVKDRLNAFSSVDYITSKHEAQSAEAGHEFIQPARYVNSVTRRSSSVVMYGLELEQVKFLGAFRKNIETLSEPKVVNWKNGYWVWKNWKNWVYYYGKNGAWKNGAWKEGYVGEGRLDDGHHGVWDKVEGEITLKQYDDRNSLLGHYVPSRQHALDLEQRLGMDIDSNPDFDSVSRADLFAMASFYLLTNPAIVPLHDGEVNRYHEAPYGVKPSSILRRASKTETKVQIIESILSRIRPEDRARVGELILLSRRKLMEGDDTTILTHVPGNEANNLVEDIIKKWDFKLWRPFPAGLERVKDMNGDWVVPELNL